MDPNDIKQNAGMEALLTCFRRRSHVLFFRIKDLDGIVPKLKPTLSLSSQATLNALRNRLSEYRLLSDLVARKIVVYIENEIRFGVQRIGNDWHIPLNFFADNSIIETAVIGENPSDVMLLLKFAECYIEREKIHGFFPNARAICGGGSVIAASLSSYLRTESSPCLSVTDSDKLHPKFKQSIVTKRCIEIVNKAANKVAEHISLEEREIENLIPHDLIKRIENANVFINQINSIVVEDPGHWKYIDLKQGLALDWVARQDSETKKYWKKAEAELNRRKKGCCLCKNGEAKEKLCECTKILGMGDNVLANAIDILSNNPLKLNLKLMQTDLRWEKIAKAIFDFTIAPKGEKVR
ncbi:hypothetical protein ACO0LG_05195 [Undibacterium sp. Ji42W]|uniref:hypothetical protein n=1 Tax=Undibacterium sp. Ji42W TaxID=3413039 RepID=UPI003BF24E22